MKISYWIFTGLFSFFMLFSCLADLFKATQAVAIMSHLGFPLYLMRFLGAAKLLGLAVLLVPRFSHLKEWAYAGFVFTLLGGFYAHLCLNDAPGEWSRPLMFFVLLTGSYVAYHRLKLVGGAREQIVHVHPAAKA